MDINLLIKSNEKYLKEMSHWKSDLAAVAMVQSCTSEFIAMQTAIDQHGLEARNSLHQALSSLSAVPKQRVAGPHNCGKEATR